MILELCLVATLGTEKIIRNCDNTGNTFAVSSHAITRLNDKETKGMQEVTSEKVTLIGFILPKDSEDLSK
jgi:hypothetical protein